MVHLFGREEQLIYRIDIDRYNECGESKNSLLVPKRKNSWHPGLNYFFFMALLWYILYNFVSDGISLPKRYTACLIF